MSAQRWVTVIVLIIIVLASTVMLTSVHDQLSDSGAGFDLGTLDDAAVTMLRAAVEPLPDPPCDPAVPARDLPDARRKACNRHYLAVVKAARAAGYEGARLRDVRDPRFHARLVAPD